MDNPLNRILDRKGWVLADGAMGTNLFHLGLQTGDSPELWNVEEPARVRAVHEGFVRAGSDLILTNTFGGTRYRLKLHNLQDRCRELNLAAARIARGVADAHEAETGREVLVAGDLGPTGELMEPLGVLTPEGAAEAFREQAEALAEGGVDLLWIETISSREEMAAAVEGASSVGLPLVCTMTFDTNGRTMMGVDPKTVGGFYHDLPTRPVGIGANCGVGPAELLDSVLGIVDGLDDDLMVVAKGNCGVPRYHDGHIHYDGSPEIMATYAKLARDAGASVIGGCCGSTAEHLRAMSEALSSSPAGPALTRERLVAELGIPWSKNGAETRAESSGETSRGGRRGRRRRDAG